MAAAAPRPEPGCAPTLLVDVVLRDASRRSGTGAGTVSASPYEPHLRVCVLVRRSAVAGATESSLPGLAVTDTPEPSASPTTGSSCGERLQLSGAGFTQCGRLYVRHYDGLGALVSSWLFFAWVMLFYGWSCCLLPELSAKPYSGMSPRRGCLFGPGFR